MHGRDSSLPGRAPEPSPLEKLPVKDSAACHRQPAELSFRRVTWLRPRFEQVVDLPLPPLLLVKQIVIVFAMGFSSPVYRFGYFCKFIYVILYEISSKFSMSLSLFIPFIQHLCMSDRFCHAVVGIMFYQLS